MSDIRDFIAARLDEDEETARAASSGPWRFNEHKGFRDHDSGRMDEAVFSGPSGVEALCVATTGPALDDQSQADAEHIARHHPARVLRQCAMVRAMLGHAKEAGGLDEFVQVSRGVGLRQDPWIDDLMLRDIAAVWSDHPDYRPEWAQV